jgi:predicted phage-related endonuclease
VVSNRLDGKALKAALPDIHSQFTRPSSSRRFTVA